jgi:hypothetical protein
MENNQNTAPEVKPNDWISVGKISAVVCAVNSTGDVEVVYLDDRDRAINEDAIWNNSEWHFKHEGPNGGYADKYDRLSSYVSTLRRGRY